MWRVKSEQFKCMEREGFADALDRYLRLLDAKNIDCLAKKLKKRGIIMA